MRKKDNYYRTLNVLNSFNEYIKKNNIAFGRKFNLHALIHSVVGPQAAIKSFTLVKNIVADFLVTAGAIEAGESYRQSYYILQQPLTKTISSDEVMQLFVKHTKLRAERKLARKLGNSTEVPVPQKTETGVSTAKQSSLNFVTPNAFFQKLDTQLDETATELQTRLLKVERQREILKQLSELTKEYSANKS